VAGGHVEVGSKAVIEGNLSVAGGNVVIRGPVKGYVQAAGGEVLIDSAIDGDVVAACGKLELGPNARIGGNLRYRAGEEMKRDPAAQVAGNVERLATRGRGITRSGVGRTWTHGWFWTAGLVVLAVILSAALPAAARHVGGELRAHPWLALLVGFVALVCIPAAAVLVMLTIIGLPIGILVILLYLALLLVGYATTAVAIGDLALARARPAAASRVAWRMAAAALAVLVIALLGRIPFLGGFVVLLAIVIGVGALFMALSSFRAKPPAAAAAAA